MILIHLKSALRCDSFDVTIGIKIPFLEFWSLLSRVAPYYSSLPRTVRYLVFYSMLKYSLVFIIIFLIYLEIQFLRSPVKCIFWTWRIFEQLHLFFMYEFKKQNNGTKYKWQLVIHRELVDSNYNFELVLTGNPMFRFPRLSDCL